MKKTVLWESETFMRKIFLGLWHKVSCDNSWQMLAAIAIPLE